MGAPRAGRMVLWSIVRPLSKHEILCSRNRWPQDLGILRPLPATLSPSNAEPNSARRGSARRTQRVHHGVAEKAKTAPTKGHHQVARNDRNGPAATTEGGLRGWRAQQTEGGLRLEGAHIGAAGNGHHKSNQPARHGNKATYAPLGHEGQHFRDHTDHTHDYPEGPAFYTAQS